MKNNKSTTKLIARYAKKYAFLAVLALIGVTVHSLCEVFKADILKNIVNAAGEGLIRQILILFMLGVVAAIIAYAAIYSNRYFSGKFAALILRDIKRDSVRHIADIPADYMSSNRTGDIISKMSADADVVQGFMESGFIQLIQIPFTIIFFGIYLIRLNAALFFICFIPVPILAVIGASFALPFKKGSKKYMGYLGMVNNTVHDMANGINLVKSYVLEKTLLKKYSKGIKKATDMATKNDRYQFTGGFIFSMIRESTALLSLVVGGYMCIKGNMTLGVLVSFQTLLTQMVSPFISASSLFFHAKQAGAASERLLSILMTDGETSGKYKANQIPESGNMIEFDNAAFSYDNATPVLSGLSFSAETGKTTALVGSSGCGKSTTFSIICGFHRHNSGDVKFMNHGTADWDINEMRKHISYVSQFSFLFPTSIYDNIGMGRKGASKEEIINAAKLANAHEFILETPHGYDTIVGERGCLLSGGQIQRLAIARAILKNAPVLLLDEATSALDIKSEYLVQQAINNLSKEKTVLIIAHRLSTVKNADKIIVIDNGKLAEEGTHDELIAKNGLYFKLYNANKQEEEANVQ